MKLSKAINHISTKTVMTATLALTLSGCIATAFPYMRAETAQRIASPVWMIKRDISASPYLLRSYERIHDRGGIVNLYIEGDGSELTSPEEWENNPTPKNPVALHLASKDRSDNVVYLARPCQYTAMISKSDNCDESAWKENRFSEETINSYKTAMDDISRRYDIRGFNLIGYAGGAAVAALIAADRHDILSLRTVAGTMDHKTQSDLLGTAELTGSLNPIDKAINLTNVPQYHFIGGQDEYVPPAVLHSYLQSMPPTNCVQTMLVQEASYDTGWVSKWPELLKLPVTCYNEIPEAMPEIDAQPLMPKNPGINLNGKLAKP